MAPSDATAMRKGRFNNRRHEVLRTAARVFSELGYRHATLEDIANSLNITRPALYYYADSKEQLLAECARIADAELAEAVARASQGPGLARLQAFFRRYLEIICDDFGRCFALSDLRELPPGHMQQMRINHRKLSNEVVKMIELGMEDGSIRPCKPLIVARVFFAAFNGAPRWYKPTRDGPAGKLADSMLEALVGGLLPTSANG